MDKKIRKFKNSYLFIYSTLKDFEILKSYRIQKYCKYLKELFDFKNYPVVKINVIESAEEFLFFSPALEHKNWIAARIGFPNIIHIYSYNTIEKNTIHKKSQYRELLYHEITHIYYLSSNLPKNDFLNEGFAQYFSGQPLKDIDYEKITKDKLYKFLSTPSRNLGNVSQEFLKNYYALSQNIIKELSEIMGCKNLIKDLKNCEDTKSIINIIEKNCNIIK